MRKYQNTVQPQGAFTALITPRLCFYYFYLSLHCLNKTGYFIGRERTKGILKIFFVKVNFLIFISKYCIKRSGNSIVCVNYTLKNDREFAFTLRERRRIYGIANAFGCCFNRYPGVARGSMNTKFKDPTSVLINYRA